MTDQGAEFGRRIGEISDAEWREILDVHPQPDDPPVPLITDVPGGIIFLPGIEAEEFEPMPWRTPSVEDIETVLEKMAPKDPPDSAPPEPRANESA